MEAAEAVVAAEQDAVPAAQPEEEVQQSEEQAAPQQSQQAEAAVEEPQAVADAAEVEPAIEQEAQQDAAMDAGGLAWRYGELQLTMQLRTSAAPLLLWHALQCIARPHWLLLQTLLVPCSAR